MSFYCDKKFCHCLDPIDKFQETLEKTSEYTCICIFLKNGHSELIRELWEIANNKCNLRVPYCFNISEDESKINYLKEKIQNDIGREYSEKDTFLIIKVNRGKIYDIYEENISTFNLLSYLTKN